MNDNRRLASESQKRANDGLFHTLKQQQDALQADARTLERLQHSAQGADGQMQALGYANQLASQQANQLLQMRAMLLAQHQVIATRMQAEVDLDAKQQAAHAASTESRIAPTSSPKNWLELAR
jgi:P-type conjugative transfer protein TrbJ